jgi:hypothetical protein
LRTKSLSKSHKNSLIAKYLGKKGSKDPSFSIEGRKRQKEKEGFIPGGSASWRGLTEEESQLLDALREISPPRHG